MQVNGFQFQGKVYIALDEGSDYYHIYGEKDGATKQGVLFYVLVFENVLTTLMIESMRTQIV